MKKILHLGNIDKFIPPFVNYNEDNHSGNDFSHLYMFYGYDKELINKPNVILCKNKTLEKIKFYPKVIKAMFDADLIIMHSLNNKVVNMILSCLRRTSILKKVHWLIWGGDLYSYQKKDIGLSKRIQKFYKKSFIPQMGGLISYLPGDFELAEKWYGSNGNRCECIAYQSNLYKKIKVANRIKNEKVNVLVGNSADVSNNHMEVFDCLKKISDLDFIIHCPLSYGDKEYRKEVIDAGIRLFGDNFNPIIKNVEFDKYNQFLSTIDVAIFNHNRQQAMGTTISLLGFGTSVYIREETSQWNFFEEKNIMVFSVNKLFLGLDRLVVKKVSENRHNIETYFSKENLDKQWGEIYRSCPN